MNGQPLDNSISSELDKVITWQYDNAANLIAIVDMMKEFFTESTTKLWDNWPVDVVNIDTANDFGLCIWGKLLNVPWLKISTGKISSELYRKILKAKVKLLSRNATIPDYCEFINTVFDGKVKVIDGLDMSLKFENNGLEGEQKSVFDNHMDVIIAYPSGVRDNNKSNSPIFALDGQQKVASTDPITGGLDESSFIYK